MSTVVHLPFTIERGESRSKGRVWTSIKLGGIVIFTELVYDNEISSAEQNIMLLFTSRLRELLGSEEL